MRLRLERVEHPQFQAQQVEMNWVPAADGAQALLRVTLQELRIGVLQQRLREVRFECEPALLADANNGGADPFVHPWRCEGPLRWRGGGGWRLAWQADIALSQVRFDLHHGGGELRLHLPVAQSPLRLEAQRVQAAWLRPLLPQVDWQEGRIDAHIEQEPAAEGVSQWRGRLQTRQLAAQAAQGTVAIAGLEVAGPFRARIDANGRMRVQAQPVLSAGELLAGLVYMEWPSGSRAELDIDTEGQGGGWRLDRFRLRDDDLALDASGAIDMGQPDWLRAFRADLLIDLGRHYGRYLEGVMAGLGQAGLHASGTVKAHLAMSDGMRIERIDAGLDEVEVRHPDGRYAFSGVNGDFAFRRNLDDEPVDVDMRWRQIKLHALAFQPGSLRARSHAGELRMRDDLRLGLFGGELVASQLVVRPLAERGNRIESSVTLRDIDLAQLAVAFQWPQFGGRLNGHLPGLRYVDSRLTAGGEIDMAVFDGRVQVANLAVERPFGVAPALSADIAMQNLDLVPMTEAFGFGRIEGRLNGRIGALRLIDWNPVAFDAELRTAEGGRRRISQLAVNQLTELGGGGGLQGRLIAAFDSFGYRRIGLTCRLQNEICHMSGLDEAAGGYTILQGSGLPSITIRGFQNRVDWPVLVQRLQSVASGEAPIVR